MNAEAVTVLLQERLDYWLPGGKGLRSVLLPELAQEIAALSPTGESGASDV